MPRKFDLDAPLESRRDLVEYLEAGGRPKADWSIGTEHEKFVFRRDDLSRPGYAGAGGIRDLLKGLERFGWQPQYEGDNVIALKMDGQSITLEPGGQFELSGAMLETLHQTCNEVHTHLDQVKEVAGELDLGFLGLGFDPLSRRQDVPVMPKARYDIMRAYMPGRGALGLDMMLRSCTVQVNLDFADEADMVKKFRTSLALQPIATALFANSPFTEGRLNGYQSFRSQVWTDTDPDRCGTLPFVFEDGFGFERYVDFALGVPMYFIYRDGRYIDASGQSFDDFLDGRLAAWPGHKPRLGDWVDHLTTIFPEVRLKQFLEMRGADAGPWDSLCALPALWVGLLYDSAALDGAAELVGQWSAADVDGLRRMVPITGLGGRFRGRLVLDIAVDVLELASAGLAARACLDGGGADERGFLDTLRAVVARGHSPAVDFKALYQGPWAGSVEPLYREHAF